MKAGPLCCLLLVLTTPAAADDGTRPATFDNPDDERRIDKLIVFPEVQGNVSVILSCFSQVKESACIPM